jgi:hypothetical protein
MMIDAHAALHSSRFCSLSTIGSTIGFYQVIAQFSRKRDISDPRPYLCGVHPSFGVELLMRVRLGC